MTQQTTREKQLLGEQQNVTKGREGRKIIWGSENLFLHIRKNKILIFLLVSDPLSEHSSQNCSQLQSFCVRKRHSRDDFQDATSRSVFHVFTSEALLFPTQNPPAVIQKSGGGGGGVSHKPASFLFSGTRPDTRHLSSLRPFSPRYSILCKKLAALKYLLSTILFETFTLHHSLRLLSSQPFDVQTYVCSPDRTRLDSIMDRL